MTFPRPPCQLTSCLVLPVGGAKGRSAGRRKGFLPVSTSCRLFFTHLQLLSTLPAPAMPHPFAGHSPSHQGPSPGGSQKGFLLQDSRCCQPCPFPLILLAPGVKIINRGNLSTPSSALWVFQNLHNQVHVLYPLCLKKTQHGLCFPEWTLRDPELSKEATENTVDIFVPNYLPPIPVGC